MKIHCLHHHSPSKSYFINGLVLAFAIAMAPAHRHVPNRWGIQPNAKKCSSSQPKKIAVVIKKPKQKTNIKKAQQLKTSSTCNNLTSEPDPPDIVGWAESSTTEHVASHHGTPDECLCARCKCLNWKNAVN